jgi:hypothetical protein
VVVHFVEEVGSVLGHLIVRRETMNNSMVTAYLRRRLRNPLTRLRHAASLERINNTGSHQAAVERKDFRYQQPDTGESRTTLKVLRL